MIDERDNIGLQFLNAINDIIFKIIPTLLQGFFQLVIELFNRVKDTFLPIIIDVVNIAFKTILSFLQQNNENRTNNS